MPNLSVREQQVFDLVWEGLRPMHIAERLKISRNNVDNIRRRLRGKGIDIPAMYRPRKVAEKVEVDTSGEWDSDEPYGPVQRCSCGLVMPCNDHSSLDLYIILRGNSNRGAEPSGPADPGTDRKQREAEAERKRKVQEANNLRKPWR